MTRTARLAPARAARRRHGRGAGSVVPRLRLRLQPRAAALSQGRQLRRRVQLLPRDVHAATRREPSGSGWSTDYPDADVNFSIRFAELTKTRVGKQPTGDPNHLVVPLTDDYLFNCPYLHLEDVGTLRVHRRRSRSACATICSRAASSGPTIRGARGPWQSWEEQIGRVLPPTSIPIRDITPDHPVFRTMFEVPELPQIPSISSLAAQRRRHLGARRGQRRADHPRDQRRARQPDGADDAQHRHLGRVGARRRRPAVLLQFSPDGYARRDQHRPLRDDALRPRRASRAPRDGRRCSLPRRAAKRPARFAARERPRSLRSRGRARWLRSRGKSRLAAIAGLGQPLAAQEASANGATAPESRRMAAR